MTEFILNIVDRNQDGLLSVKEGAAAACVILGVVFAAVFAVLHLLERSRIRKTSIFRVKKNKYKSRLGKKNIKY